MLCSPVRFAGYLMRCLKDQYTPGTLWDGGVVTADWSLQPSAGEHRCGEEKAMTHRSPVGRRQPPLRRLGGRGVLRGIRRCYRAASRRQGGPVALRPWLSPGVPLSMEGAIDLRGGTNAVKHLLL